MKQNKIGGDFLSKDKDDKKQKEYTIASKNLERCLDNMTNAYSTYDCTGLIPSEPVNDAERESYNEVYNYLPPDSKA